MVRSSGGTVADMRLKLAFLALIIAQACASAPAPVDDDRARTIALLTHQADAWDKAIIRKDRAAIEANMAEDFRQIDGGGNVATKTSFVEGLMSPALEIDPYTVEEFDVRLYGDVALLSGRTDMTGRYDGKTFSSHYRYNRYLCPA